MSSFSAKIGLKPSKKSVRESDGYVELTVFRECSGRGVTTVL